MCEAALSEFLKEVHETKDIDHSAMVSILVAYCSSDDTLTQFIAVNWMSEFIILAQVLHIY